MTKPTHSRFIVILDPFGVSKLSIINSYRKLLQHRRKSLNFKRDLEKLYGLSETDSYSFFFSYMNPRFLNRPIYSNNSGKSVTPVFISKLEIFKVSRIIQFTYMSYISKKVKVLRFFTDLRWHSNGQLTALFGSSWNQRKNIDLKLKGGISFESKCIDSKKGIWIYRLTTCPDQIDLANCCLKSLHSPAMTSDHSLVPTLPHTKFIPDQLKLFGD